jgi:16S rRNA (guanine(966)-N(2))-methyltransferase RsmD
MKILGGRDCSRLIKVPRLKELRPTADRVRKALFDILQEEIAGKDVLDLFSGSGAIGLEAISRGANSACFVEREKSCIIAIRENIRLLGYEDRAFVIFDDVFKALRDLDKSKKSFDIIIMDPPYRKSIEKKALLKISTYDIIKPSSLIVVEHIKTEQIPDCVGIFRLYKRSSYGDSALSFYNVMSTKQGLR